MFIKKTFKYTPTYLMWKNKLRKNKVPDYSKFIKTAISKTPYYKNNTKYLAAENLPILRKSDIQPDPNTFIRNKVIGWLSFKTSTGGTTGVSINLFQTLQSKIRESVFVDDAFKKITTNPKIGVLRGNKVSNGFYKLKQGKLILSSYKISSETIDDYLKIIEEKKINCLHAYPSSLMIFLKYIRDKNLAHRLSNIKGILTSSEVFTRDDKIFLKELLPDITLIDLYGQNEHVAFAVAKDLGYFSFSNIYGNTEFVETGETINNNKIAEIVSTGYLNPNMPLIRYGTEDYAELDKQGNVLSIIGRAQDFVFDKNGRKLPCILQTRPNTLKKCHFIPVSSI